MASPTANAAEFVIGRMRTSFPGLDPTRQDQRMLSDPRDRRSLPGLAGAGPGRGNPRPLAWWALSMAMWILGERYGAEMPVPD